MIPVILSGGSGTRLWPVSRRTHPKQFWPLASELSMLQETYQRLHNYQDIDAPVIICNHDHRFFVAHQMIEIGQDAANIILEPIGRNTAPAAAIAAFHALNSKANSEEPDPILLILPADHVIDDIQVFHSVLAQGKKLAEEGQLVTFGIMPTGPETGYGYIQGDGRVGVALNEPTPTPMRIKRFVEKPDKETAQTYVDSGNYFWNSGMFMFRASRYLDELEQFAPDIHHLARQAYEKATRDMDFIRLDEETFADCPSDSIDYTVMENTKSGVVIPLDAGWSDVGSWSALWEIGDKDESGNVLMGDVIALESENCYLRSDSRLLATIGIDNLVVVETQDVVMVAPRDQVQKVKHLVEKLSDVQREETDIHAQVHRPWGCFQGIDRAERYQVKRISVRPGASLSLQMHHHRAEHWIVVSGTARVTCGDKIFMLSENQSTYIPIGEKHRLENPGQIPLDIIEIQSGSYLGEDDIVRFDDNYGRGG